MAKAIKKAKKKRAKTYEPKVKFEGSLEDMLKISATGAGVKKEEKRNNAMVIAIIIFACAAAYAFVDYYKTQDSKDLGFAIILFIGAIATFIQTLDTNAQSDNIERLSQLDTSISHHIDTLATIDTNISSNTNGIVGNIYNLSQQNIALSDSIRKIDSIVYDLTKKINAVSNSSHLLSKRLDEKTDQEFAVSGEFHLFLNPNSELNSIIFGGARVEINENYFQEPFDLRKIIALNMPDPLIFQIVNNELYISFKIFDIKSNLIAEIENNKWRINKNLVGKFNYDNKGIEIFDNAGRIVLNLDILKNNSIQIQGIFRRRDHKEAFVSSTGMGTFNIEDDKTDFLKQTPFRQLFEYNGIKWHGVRKHL